MPVGATIGAAVITAGVGLVGSNMAANTEAAAADRASQTQLQMYDQTRGDLKPYSTTGQAATYTLAGLYGLPGADGQTHPPDFTPFENSPDYAFAKSEGIKALDASAAANGNLLSGGMFKELEEYGSGLASQNYGNYVNRLMGLAQMGENAAAQTGSFGANAAAGVAGNQLRAGEARASGIVGGANAINGGVGNVLSAFNQSQGYSGAYAGSRPLYQPGPPGSVG